MKKLFKKYFVPHKENDYKPHLFRDAGVGFLLIVIIALFGLSVSNRIILTRTDFLALVLPKVLVDYANEDRSVEHYNQLAISPLLEKAAQLKANDMAEKGYFAHKSPDGHTPWYWFRQVEYDFSYAGENLAVNFNDSIDVNTAWMNSPGHRDNIMNSNFSEIGIATAEGMYQGKITTFVVQLFGRPAEKEAIIVKVSKVSTTTNTTVVKPKANSETILSETASSEVLAEDGNGTDEIFISVEKKSADATSSDLKYSNFFERITLSPNKFLSFAYSIIAVIILITLSFMVFIEVENRHPRHILVAVGIIIIITGLLYIYRNLLFYPVIIL